MVRRFWGLCAVLLIGLAVFVTVGRELAPQVTQYRAELETYLSEAMDVQVSIDAIAASWEGLSPELRLRGLKITSRDGEQILAVETAYAELSLLRSLFNWELVLGQLEFVDIAMGFEQNAEGIWSLPGLDPRVSTDIGDPLDMFLLGDHIEFRNALFTFNFRTGHSSRVELPHLVLENSGNFHRLRSEVAVDRNRDVLSLVIEAHGDPRNLDSFAATGHLKLQRFELDKAVAALPGQWWDGLPDQEWRNGHELNLELWFDVAAGMVIDTRGRLDIGELPVGLDETLVMPQRTTASFAGHWAKNGAWRLAFRDFSLAWEEAQSPNLDLLLSSANLGEPVHLQTEQIDLEQWYSTIQAAGLVKSGALLDAMDALQPRGILRNVKISLAGTRLQDLTLRANLEDLAFSSWQGAPAVQQANGYVEATPLGGFVDIVSEQGFSMHYPTLFHHALEFDAARGRVHWQIDTAERAVNVHSGLLSVSGDKGEGRGYFSLFLPFEFGSEPEELVLQVGLRDSELRHYEYFVPHVLPDTLVDWLNQSVGKGRVSSGGFVYRGGLTKAAVEQAAIQLFVNVEDAELAYHPDWPVLEQASGVMWLDDRTVSADVNSGRLFNTRLEDGKISVELNTDNKKPLLNIAGQAEGNASDGLRFIRETPLSEVIGPQLFTDWTLEGRMQTSVDVTIPLQSGAKPGIEQVDVNVRQARLTTGDLNLEFGDVEGLLSYDDQRGLYAEQIEGVLWGKPVTASIRQTLPTSDQLQGLSLYLAGTASIQSLHEWSARPELQFFEGATNFDAKLTVPFGPAAREGQVAGRGQGEAAHLRVQTDLTGVTIDLPQPFGKAPEAKQLLTITAPLNEGNSHYTLRYGDILHGVLAMSGGELVSAGLSLGGEAHLPSKPRLAVNGRIDLFEFGEWRKVLERYNNYQRPTDSFAAAGDQLKSSIGLQIGTLIWNDIEVEDLHLEAEQAVDYWQFEMDSALIAGAARLYNDGGKPILLDLDHLHLPEAEPELPEYFNPFLPPPEPRPSDLWANLDPTSLPAMDSTVREFSIGGEDYGQWSFELRPTDTGAVARQIVGNIRGGQIIGIEEGQGAELFWDKTDGEINSRFNGRFVSDNLGNVLRQWDQPHLLDSESSRFDARLSWPGSPAAISLTALQGDIAMAVKKGTFIRGAGDASTGSSLLELIAFFNFDTWLRRLRLDFSDLSRAGTAFETMEGVLQFDQGKVYMNTPMVVNSHSSRFQMAGVVDLVESELDTKLVATIPVGGNLTFVAALAGMGLPAVAGMWLISKVFEEQIGKMSSLSFRVTGPLDDPQMNFVRLFDDQAVQNEIGANIQK